MLYVSQCSNTFNVVSKFLTRGEFKVLCVLSSKSVSSSLFPIYQRAARSFVKKFSSASCVSENAPSGDNPVFLTFIGSKSHTHDEGRLKEWYAFDVRRIGWSLSLIRRLHEVEINLHGRSLMITSRCRKTEGKMPETLECGLCHNFPSESSSRIYLNIGAHHCCHHVTFSSLGVANLLEQALVY